MKNADEPLDAVTLPPARRVSPLDMVNGPVLRARFANGFWCNTMDPTDYGGRRTVWHWRDSGVDVHVKVTGNLLDEPGIRYRRVTVDIHEADQEDLLAIAGFSLFQSPGGSYRDMDYREAMDEYSQGALELSERLIDGFGPLHSQFRLGRTLSEFKELEVRPDCRLKGQGTALGWRLMGELMRRYGAWLFVFKPYPLQYAFVPMAPCSVAVHREGYEAGLRKLTALYADKWGALPLPDSEGWQFAAPTSEFTFDKRKKRWVFVGDR